jgi:hypothetical protein
MIGRKSQGQSTDDPESGRGHFPKTEAQSLISKDDRAVKIGVFGNFKIEGSSVGTSSRVLAWRATVTDETTGLRHEFYIRGGKIYHVQFYSSPPRETLHKSPACVVIE